MTMTDLEFGHLDRLPWAWIVPIAIACAVLGVVRHRRRLRAFASASLLPKLMSPVPALRAYGRVVLTALALALTMLALLDPRWGERYEEVEQRGIDLVFVLDVSRSMLAQDARPDRLTRAKQIASDMVDELRGDRVALVTAAGAAAVTCPLTVDKGAFRLALDLADPQTAARGGSLLGDALRVAATAFVDDIPDHKAVVLLTDGEDHDSYPVEAARQLFEERGIRVFTISVGDAERGARIPVAVDGRRTFLEFEGAEVWSRVDESLLSELALVAGGAFVPVGTRAVDVERLYREHIEPMAARTFDTEQRQAKVVQFHWFAGAALLLLALESVVGMPRARRDRATRVPAGAWKRASRSAVIVLGAFLVVEPGRSAHARPLAPPVSPESTESTDPVIGGGPAAPTSDRPATPEQLTGREHLKRANAALAAGDDAAAARHYAAAGRAFPDMPGIPYNQGVALHRLGRYREAADAFGRAHELGATPESRARAAYNLGTSTHADALQAAQGAAADPGAPAAGAADPTEQQARLEDAMERLGESIAHYRRALAADPVDDDARVNAELAQRLLEQLQQAQPPQQSGSDENQDEGDEQDQQQQQEQQQQQDQQSQDQQDQDQQDQEQQDQQQEQEPQQDQQQQDQQEQDQEQQEQDEQQQSAAEQEQQEEQQPQPQGEAEQRMSREEAERLLQRVRDRDRQRQEERQEQERARHQPARRDW